MARPAAKVNRRASGRERGASGRNHLLDVRIRTSTARRRRKETVARWVWNLFAAAVVVIAAFLGVRAVLDKFFFQNADYTLNRITMELDGAVTREEALSRTGLREGINIFSVDLAAVEASLSALPQVESVRVTRQLPDHLDVTLAARKPVAWVAAPGETGDPTTSERSLLVDPAGYLMRPTHIRPEYYHLPAIYGVVGDDIRGGELLHNEDLRSALGLLEALSRHPESLLRIRTMDISRGYAIEVVNDRNARITFGTADFESQLARLQQLLLHCEETGRLLESVNLVVKRNTPVTFVALAAAPAPPVAAPAATPAKTRRN